jgi:glycosyltransferase involved in cell wall biosynthesis
MPYLLSACDIYAAPSRLEGFGMIQVEANACENLFQHCGGIDCRTGLQIEAGEALAEGQMVG